MLIQHVALGGIMFTFSLQRILCAMERFHECSRFFMEPQSEEMWFSLKKFIFRGTSCHLVNTLKKDNFVYQHIKVCNSI